MSDYDILTVIANFQSLWPPRLQEAYTHRYLHRVVRKPMRLRATDIEALPRNGLVPIPSTTFQILCRPDKPRSLGPHRAGCRQPGGSILV